MNTEQKRASFEAWSHGRCELHLVNPAGRYSSAITQFAWEAYQAALESPEVQALLEALKVLVDNGGIGPESMFDDARDALAAMEKNK